MKRGLKKGFKFDDPVVFRRRVKIKTIAGEKTDEELKNQAIETALKSGCILLIKKGTIERNRRFVGKIQKEDIFWCPAAYVGKNKAIDIWGKNN